MCIHDCQRLCVWRTLAYVCVCVCLSVCGSNMNWPVDLVIWRRVRILSRHCLPCPALHCLLSHTPPRACTLLASVLLLVLLSCYNLPYFPLFNARLSHLHLSPGSGSALYEYGHPDRGTCTCTCTLKFLYLSCITIAASAVSPRLHSTLGSSFATTATTTC
ncbi:hypothetical protein J3F84DRAFT_199427 [Trichoderma pleuroticola]